jgi:hypothetical protein
MAEEQEPELEGVLMGEEEGERLEIDSREQDRLLPIANISRIMKRALPGNAKMSKVTSLNAIKLPINYIIGT